MEPPLPEHDVGGAAVRWFKHMTGSHNDESLCRMMDKFGLEGYGAYWVVLEAIAAQCDKSDKTSITLSVKNWRKIVPFAPQKLTKWLAFAQQLTLFSVEISENLVKVSCPKLLKYRDEYSERRAKKSGECRDNLPSELDIDTELDKYTAPPERGSGHTSPVEGVAVAQRKAKTETKDPRPTGCPVELWERYLRISHGYHKSRADQLGRQAPFTAAKVREGARTFDNLIRVRGYPEEEIVAVLGWATDDPFWSSNLRSIGALLKKSASNGELKLSNVLAAITSDLERKRNLEAANG